MMMMIMTMTAIVVVVVILIAILMTIGDEVHLNILLLLIIIRHHHILAQLSLDCKRHTLHKNVSRRHYIRRSHTWTSGHVVLSPQGAVANTFQLVDVLAMICLCYDLPPFLT